MSLHVVQLGPIPPPEGGISRNMFAIRDELIARGDRCSLIATSKSTSVIDEPNVYHPRSAAALLKLLASVHFDVLHLHVGGDLSRRVMMLGAAGAVLARGRSVLTVHSGEYSKTKAAQAARRDSLTGRVFRGFTRLIAVNEELADVFARFGVSAERISIIPPFALKTPDATASIPREVADLAAAHDRVLLWIGGMERDYDPQIMIKAFEEVQTEAPDCGLIMVGGGSLKDEVARSVRSSVFAEHILLAGNVEHAVTLRLMQDADAVVRTTLFDGDAISIREALFLGTPVIATDTGARPEGTQLVPIGDPIALSEKIKIVLKAKKKPASKPVADNSNVQAVIDLYDGLSGRK